MYLSIHSYFSLRYGTLSPAQLVEEAARLGLWTLPLTDINNSSAAFAFAQACAKEGLKPVYGMEFRRDGRYLFTALARNAEGIREINELLTACSIAARPLPPRAPEWRHSFVVYRQAPCPVDELRDYEFIGIKPAEVPALYSSPLRPHVDRLVVYSPVSFLNGQGFRIHKLLRCIDLNIVLGKLEPSDCADPDEYFWRPEAIREAFTSYPRIVQNSEAILEQCHFEMPACDDNNRKSFTGGPAGDYKLLAKLAFQGCRRRYGPHHDRAEDRVRRELQVIHRMGFSAYFLITWDIVRYAQSAGYYHVGRGSGANSIVAYCLYITDVDPLELDLYFERFINPHRTSPPDFDIDFSWAERDDVTEYIFERYGREYTALLATYNTFKGKSIIRELGKVFGLPKADIDTIVDQPLATHKHHAFARHIFHYGKAIEKFPNYLSIHAGGIIISERPLSYHTALMQMPKGFPITHFDMYGAEDLHFHKYDILSQRGLGHIKDAVDLVRRNQGRSIEIHDITAIKSNARVREQLRSGHCIGCFYIESPAMRGLLHKLRCDNYVHLVAASSIIRPGVAQSGMMREYIERFHHPEKVQYLHPVFEENLSETYGVMVYQEDVMKIVHHFAGLDLDESDVLRRIMTGKRKSSDTFRMLMEKYFRNCKERGYSEELTHEVWRQIESFSGYSFCKAHSASFAVESFQSLFLKAHYPVEFMVAVINNFGGFYNTELYVHEARMCGARIEAPCVNHSRYLTDLEGTTIWIGFIHIQSLEQAIGKRIALERDRHGTYRDLEDFIRRVPMGREQLQLLIRIGALRFTGMSKGELMWEKNAVPEMGRSQAVHPFLFSDGSESFVIPSLEESRYDQAFDEIELLGFPLCNPFDLLAEEARGTIPASQLRKCMGRQVNLLGYYVCQKPVRTKQGKLMAFGTWLDRDGNFFDTTHFPPEMERFPFQGRGCYWIRGRVVDDFDFASIEVSEMRKLPYVKDGRY
ncbi:MAG TPA: DNA polymerase III subunit alpha [Saprospiraceae bacterium]|nr:DNA polymerase III subunit alpha [Saprospiraceae bacterium]